MALFENRAVRVIFINALYHILVASLTRMALVLRTGASLHCLQTFKLDFPVIKGLMFIEFGCGGLSVQD